MIAYVVYNICNLFVFGAIAFAFEKWWIILFALLFVLVPTKKTVKKPCRICDCCGKSSESADNQEAAIKLAKSRGWIHIEESDKDFCPECISVIKEEPLYNEMDYKR